MFFVSAVYIYITANCTSVMMRVYQSLEQYRSRVTLVDSFLRRNKVRSSLRRLVRLHFKQEFTEGQSMTDDTLLRQMPQGLRREVMIDINMRTLRVAPIFLGCDVAMVAMICSHLNRALFMKDELICKQGDVVRAMGQAPNPFGWLCALAR